ncbi:MAG: TolC family protein [Bacteroidetes bacterium]|nr:MAG: TolC family protein [Bacteroidota bacterium]
MTPRFSHLILCLLPVLAQAQSITLKQCYSDAYAHSPLADQAALARMSAILQDKNLATRWMPQLNLSGQVSYQSDVVTFPEIGGIAFPDIPKAQYRAGLDIQQTIYDGGATKQARTINELQSEVQVQTTETDLYRIREAINQLFFALCITERQKEVLATVQNDLRTRRKPVESGVKNGVLLPGNLESLDKQILQLDQQMLQLDAEIRSLRAMLAEWTGRQDLRNAPVGLPDSLPALPDSLPQLRPEYRLFDLQSQQLDASAEAVLSQARPKVAAFAQGGLAQPNPYNFLKTEFGGYYMVGLRVNVPLTNWGQIGRGRELFDVQKSALDIRKEQFEQGLVLSLIRDREQLTVLDSLISRDEDIVAIQESIVKQAAAQMENGVRTISEYLSEVNALTQARLQQEIRRVQQVQARVALLTRLGLW